MTSTSFRATTPVGRRRRRRRWVPWLVGALMVLVAGIGAGLIIGGSTTSSPPPAPTPDTPFSAVAPPSTLVAGDVIPPGTGPATAAASTSAGDPQPVDAGVSPGTDTEPPVHVGPWTFEGPNRLFIQSLGVEAPIDTVGSDLGAMIIPTDVQRVGRWDGGADLADDHGTILIAGHVNYSGQGPGVLYNLYRIRPGAVIVTNDGDGIRSSWRVVELTSVSKQALPVDIFTRSGPRRLVLVTCGGELLHIDGPDGGHNTYQNNVLVYAVPA